MDFSKIIKTKTIKVNHPNFNKIKLQLKPVCFDISFINNNKVIGGNQIWFAVSINNEEFVKSILREEKIDNETIEEIINFLSQHYKLDLSKHTLP
jgi:hypothetical protein